MKKNRHILDVVLLAGLALVSFVAVAPEALVMPNSVQMVLLALVSGLIATFLVLLWREHPTDEREAQNQAFASRAAYIVGSTILITSLIVQSIRHDLDPIIPVVLLAMISTKILVQRYKDDI